MVEIHVLIHLFYHENYNVVMAVL